MNKASETAGINLEALERDLVNQIWDAADSVARGYNGLDKLSDLAVEQYARGYHHALESLAEANALRMDSLRFAFGQIRAALGERLRRNNSPNQKLPGRAPLLNEVLAQIRDKRIAMRDRYELLEYNGEFRAWKKRLRRFELNRYEAHEFANWQVVDVELDAIWALSSRLIADKAWFARHYEATHPKEEVAA